MRYNLPLRSLTLGTMMMILALVASPPGLTAPKHHKATGKTVCKVKPSPPWKRPCSTSDLVGYWSVVDIESKLPPPKPPEPTDTATVQANGQKPGTDPKADAKSAASASKPGAPGGMLKPGAPPATGSMLKTPGAPPPPTSASSSGKNPLDLTNIMAAAVKTPGTSNNLSAPAPRVPAPASKAPKPAPPPAVAEAAALPPAEAVTYHYYFFNNNGTAKYSALEQPMDTKAYNRFQLSSPTASYKIDAKGMIIYTALQDPQKVNYSCAYVVRDYADKTGTVDVSEGDVILGSYDKVGKKNILVAEQYLKKMR